MLLLGVQSPPRVQGTKRLPERGAQRALHQRLVIGSGHVPTQEQHRVCSQLRGRVSLRGRRSPGRGQEAN